MKQLYQNGSIMVNWTSKNNWDEELTAGDNWFWAYEDNTGTTYFCLFGLEITVLNTPL